MANKLIPPSTIPIRSNTNIIAMASVIPNPQSFDDDLIINDEEIDSLMKESSSPLKLTESDDSFLCQRFLVASSIKIANLQRNLQVN